MLSTSDVIVSQKDPMDKITALAHAIGKFGRWGESIYLCREYTPLHKKGIKKIQNKPMKTTKLSKVAKKAK